MFFLCPYALICPLWLLLVSNYDEKAGRYEEQDDLEDELQDLEESPKTFQVWRNGRIIYASVNRNDVRRWVLDPKNLKRGDWTNTVIREIQL